MENICQICGRPLTEKESKAQTCTECLLALDFTVNLEDKDKIEQDLEQIIHYFTSDVASAFKKDPAAKSIVEVLTSYPGIQAVLLYRVAHFLWEVGIPFVPRYISFIARQLTGIDIHPGAKIGQISLLITAQEL